MRALRAAVGVVWLAAIVGGFVFLNRWDSQPGAAAHPDARWPAESRIVRATDRPTLVMLAHPRCSCTRASISELAEIMGRSTTRPKAYVVFIKPSAMGVDWERTDLWQSAARIPGVTVLRDDDSTEAALFGGETSGQTFLYAADGRLIFSGGTTGSRGHQGDNAGRASILSLLDRASASPASPVFGCPLFGDGDRDAGETHDADHVHGAE